MKQENLKKENKRMKLLAIGAGVSLMASGALAEDVSADGNSFGDLFDTFSTWLSGSLGKLLALLGFAGTFIVYMMTHKGSVLFIGIIISLIAGGMIGISQTFFEAGSTSFDTYDGTGNTVNDD